jgi:hypothetical protein
VKSFRHIINLKDSFSAREKNFSSSPKKIMRVNKIIPNVGKTIHRKAKKRNIFAHLA